MVQIRTLCFNITSDYQFSYLITWGFVLDEICLFWASYSTLLKPLSTGFDTLKPRSDWGFSSGLSDPRTRFAFWLAFWFGAKWSRAWSQRAKWSLLQRRGQVNQPRTKSLAIVKSLVNCLTNEHITIWLQFGSGTSISSQNANLAPIWPHFGPGSLSAEPNSQSERGFSASILSY